MDLGHVTFGTVSDWSEEQEKNLEQGVLQATTETMETDDDDDGKPLSLPHKIKSENLLLSDEEFATPLSTPPCETTDGDSALSRPVDSSQLSSAISNAVSTTSRGSSRSVSLSLSLTHTHTHTLTTLTHSLSLSLSLSLACAHTHTHTHTHTNMYTHIAVFSDIC